MAAQETKPNTMEEEEEEERYLDDAEEALSLCDLPIYSTPSADWEVFSREDQSSSSMSEQDNYFEFFSEEWSSTRSYLSADSVVFCGKLIPYKQPSVSNHIHKLKSNDKHRIQAKRSVFPWKYSKSSINKPRTSCKSSSRNDYSVRRVPMVSTKSRWYLFAFGLSRFPTEMDNMGDIRRRQSRNSPSRKSNRGGARTIEWGLWGLIRALVCGGNHHVMSVVQQASYGCMYSTRA